MPLIENNSLRVSVACTMEPLPGPVVPLAPLVPDVSITSMSDTAQTGNAATASQVCHGSAAGSQPGPLGGNNSSVAKPSRAIVSPTETETAAHPAAKRTRSAGAEIITQPVLESEDISLELSSNDSPIKGASPGSVHVPAPSGLPPAMPTDVEGRAASPLGNLHI